jgi:hypothetical protein
MPAYMATIERSNRKPIDRVEVDITITDLSAGRRTWRGEFVSRSVDGILPDEHLSLTFDNGQKGSARVRETHFDSRNPASTRITFDGTGPLA